METSDNSYRKTLRQLLRRNSAVTLVVGLAASVIVYGFHDWFHGVLLPAIGVGPALADALGSFLIIAFATVGVRLASYAAFRDPFYGLPRDVESLRQDKRKLADVLKATEKVASIDRLTGVWNRHYFEELMANETDRVRRHGHLLSLLIIDIDKFKAVNDSLGHAAGDGVLKAVAQRLGLTLRSSDSLCRYGGEEFVVVCPDTPLSTAVVLAERLRSTVCAAPVEPAGTVTVSIGVAQYHAGETWGQCLERADAMLYQAKERGRNQVQYDSDMTEPAGLSASEAPSEPQVLRLEWHPSYACGIDQIDKDHITLFAHADDLLNAMAFAKPHAELCGKVDFVVQEVQAHFAREEAILERSGWPGTAIHQQHHRQLVRKAQELADNFRQQKVDSGAVFEFLAQDLIAKHILLGDRHYFAHVVQSQMPASGTDTA
ncbi:diguanylate cyclase [Curvibacter sp. APW13]|uniref:diguanylate cyclase n=1 Tax=Curvibacter sp. APW13 TaxID=3077236 RepID=UPI0028DD770F|nr:diguanylate cyclase [Curvibacter sp. APW13]MDT8989744.1 diguanylate cyclase [Curvibacter sp. APW13]